MKDILFSMSILFLVSGCISQLSLHKPPEEITFWNITNEKYILHKYDCSNKSAKYAYRLNNKGYNADVCIVQPKESIFSHAIVRVKYSDNKIIYYDVTKGEFSPNINKFGRLLRIISFSDLEKMIEDESPEWKF